MIAMKVVRNVILNNIDLHDQTSRMHRSQPGVAKIFQIKNIQRFNKSDTNILDLIIECFSRDKSCQK